MANYQLYKVIAAAYLSEILVSTVHGSDVLRGDNKFFVHNNRTRKSYAHMIATRLLNTHYVILQQNTQTHKHSLQQTVI